MALTFEGLCFIISVWAAVLGKCDAAGAFDNALTPLAICAEVLVCRAVGRIGITSVTANKKDRLREYVKWLDGLLRSMDTCLSREDPSSVWKHSGYFQFARKYNQIAIAVAQEIQLPPVVDLFDLEKIPGSTSTIAMQQKEIFEAVHANASVLKAYLESQLDVVDDEVAALRDFLHVLIRSAVLRRPEKERDVQDALEQVLIGRGLVKGQDYDREVGRVKISAKEVVPDFILPKLNLAIEVKFIKDVVRVKAAIDEIGADIVSYSKKYRRILFVVYDMGFIRDELEFRHDLELTYGVSVLVIKN